MTPLEITLVSTIIPFLIALTAWLRAEVANKAAKVANTTAQNAGLAAAHTMGIILANKPATPPADGNAK